MSLLLIKARRLLVSALVAMGITGGFVGSALALTCTPGVGFNTTTGFELGCASSALWSVLSVNQSLTSGASAPILEFNNGGINGSVGSVGNIGAYGGVKVNADANATFSGNIMVQSGTTPATDTSGVIMGAPPDPSIVVDNALLTQARADALLAASQAAALTANQTFGAITDLKTINATKSGLNVIKITGGISLNGALKVLTFNTGSYSNVEFVVNITGGNFNMANYAKVVLTGGSTADPFNYTDLLFNVQGAQTVSLGTHSQVAGIILDVGGNVNMSQSTVTGEVIGGHDIHLWNSSTVVNNTASTANVISGCTTDPVTGVMTCVIRTAPEPGTIALLVLGLLGVFGARMRQRGRPLSVVPA